MKKHTVLVVDDSRISQQHLVQILHSDYIVHAASGGAEAIQVAKAAKPDIILLDIVMPQLDGYETLVRLKEQPETKHIPVIFITSLDTECDEEKGLRLGADDYISKPYNPTIVKLRISILLKIVEQLRTINELSMMDATSGLPNRKYFDKRLREEWQRASKENRRLGVLMLDMDKMRSFNTIYGYAHGDKALVAVAEIISKTALKNPGDFAARWAFGGFVVLLQNVNDEECSAVGENIRKAVEELELLTEDGQVTTFAISVGATSIHPGEDDTTVEQFIANADSALYLAKELVRNQVVVHN